MELCTGGSLVSGLKNQKAGYDESMAATLVEKILSAILYCHHHGIVHRDIKLDNIIFESKAKDAELKLIDFGFASAVEPGNEVMTAHLGTPSYMAPELWLRESTGYDSSVDMWAIGASAYMLLSGTRPFHSSDKHEKARMIVEDELAFPSYLWKQVSEDARDFCTCLMQKHPKDRLSASEALKHPWIRKHSSAHSDPGDAAAMLKRHTEMLASLEDYAEAGRMRQIALDVIAFTTPSPFLEEHRSVFQAIDSDGSGTIVLQEFADAMSGANSPRSPLELEELFNAIDVNGSGEIDYTEWLGATVSSCGSNVLCPQSVRAAFRMLDGDQDGYITGLDLSRTLEGQLSDDVMEDCLMPCADAHGRVSYSTFERAVLRNKPKY